MAWAKGAEFQAAIDLTHTSSPPLFPQTVREERLTFGIRHTVIRGPNQHPFQFLVAVASRAFWMTRKKARVIGMLP